MKSQFAFARVAYGAVAIFFWMAGVGQVIIAFTPRGEKTSLLTALVFAVIGIIPFLRYRYWSRRAAELNARPQKLKIALAATGCAVVLTVFVAPSFFRARVIAECNTCNNYQVQIEGAKENWRIDYHKAANDVPTWGDLAGKHRYLRKVLVFPAGGVYTLGRLDEVRDARLQHTGWRLSHPPAPTIIPRGP